VPGPFEAYLRGGGSDAVLRMPRLRETRGGAEVPESTTRDRHRPLSGRPGHPGPRSGKRHMTNSAAGGPVRIRAGRGPHTTSALDTIFILAERWRGGAGDRVSRFDDARLDGRVFAIGVPDDRVRLSSVSGLGDRLGDVEQCVS